MNKPQKPFIEGNEPQLIEKELGTISPYPDLQIDLHYDPDIKIEGIEVYIPTGSLLENLASFYLKLNKVLKQKGYVEFKTRGDNEFAYFYGYRYETPEEVAIRLNREVELEKQYERQLVNYESWLKKELDNFNK